MKAITRLLTAILLLLPPAAAFAQTPEADVQRTLDRARQSGIPVALLESKIAEGRAKGVPMARIAAAVERRLIVLERVRTNIDPLRQLSTEELGVAGDAIVAGVSEAHVKTISGSAPRERRAVAIAALSQLVRLGHPSEEALRRVTQALQNGPEALMNLPAQAAAARRGPPGGPPGLDGAAQGRGGPPPGVPGRGKKPVKPGN
ncbi:MAG TPA: hypothetical protein VK912_16360 [Longimicrobiales bacterium]|nr:hypothetical protein [Longimicrobiales bacterium]